MLPSGVYVCQRLRREVRRPLFEAMVVERAEGVPGDNASDVPGGGTVGGGCSAGFAEDGGVCGGFFCVLV